MSGFGTSSQLFILVALSSSHSCPARAWSLSYELLSFMNFSSVSPSYELQFSTSQWFSKVAHVLPGNLLCMGSSLWPAVPARNMLQPGFSTGCSFLQGTSTPTGSFSSCPWISAPLRTSSHIFSFFFPPISWVAFFFLPFLKYIIATNVTCVQWQVCPGAMEKWLCATWMQLLMPSWNLFHQNLDLEIQ